MTLIGVVYLASLRRLRDVYELLHVILLRISSDVVFKDYQGPTISAIDCIAPRVIGFACAVRAASTGSSQNGFWDFVRKTGRLPNPRELKNMKVEPRDRSYHIA